MIKNLRKELSGDFFLRLLQQSHPTKPIILTYFSHNAIIPKRILNLLRMSFFKKMKQHVFRIVFLYRFTYKIRQNMHFVDVLCFLSVKYFFFLELKSSFGLSNRN